MVTRRAADVWVRVSIGALTLSVIVYFYSGSVGYEIQVAAAIWIVAGISILLYAFNKEASGVQAQTKRSQVLKLALAWLAGPAIAFGVLSVLMVAS